MQTNLENQAISQEMLSLQNQLSSLAIKDVNLKVKSDLLSEKLGNQYVLVILPLGQIVNKNVEQLVLQEFYRDLTLREYSIKDDSENELSVNILSTQLSAFDFLFTRRVVAKIKLAVIYQEKATGKAYSKIISLKESEFVSLPFAKKLTKIYKSLIRQAVKRVTNDIWPNNSNNSINQ